MKNKYCVMFYLDRRLKMELNSKDDLLSTLDEILSRLSVIEQSTTQETESEETEKPETENEETEVESVDEIEKLLNS